MNHSEWLACFASDLKRGDIAAVAAGFHETSYWRDLVAFTWNIVTFESRSAIADMLAARLADVRPDSFEPEGSDGWFTFATSVGRGRGHIRLKDGKCHTLFTALMSLDGFEETSGPTRESGVDFLTGHRAGRQ